MSRKVRVSIALLAAIMLLGLFSGCSSAVVSMASTATESSSAETNSTVDNTTKKEVTWLASRPVDGAIDLTVREIAKKYTEEVDPNFSLKIETTTDRTSYLQKLRTLIAGGNMPDIIDIDADPYCQELVNQGLLVDVKKYLKDEGLYDQFKPVALAYQEFTDGTMYTLPLEYHVEMTWYNKEIFSKYNLTAPKTMNEFMSTCKTLKDNGIIPISVDGVDKWPVMRYLAMLPFRATGNEYIINVRDGKASLKEQTGMDGINFLADVGQYFNEGFASTDYVTALNLFLDGKSAMYYMGDWEQGSMLDHYQSGKVDYFYLPMTNNAKTAANEFCMNSGIGMAFNTKTFDANTRGFINYLIKNYGVPYAKRNQMSPMKIELPKDIQFSDLYLRIENDMANSGTNFLKPWDTYLDPDSLSVMNDNMILVAMGQMKPEDFADLMDTTIANNVAK